MRIICAPDSFKGTLTAREAAEAMAAGAHDVDPAIEAIVCPIGDGGEGTMDALVSAMHGELRQARVTGPLGEPVEASYGCVAARGLAIVELARASGLTGVPPDRRDPAGTTTFGTGELIRRALDDGFHSVIVGVGGSATNDGGAGLAQALGVRFLDHRDQLITTPLTGGDLTCIRRIDPAGMHPRLRIRVACDVTNPLYGPDGAAVVYGPQKGAGPEQVEGLDLALRHLASLTTADPDTPGAGAAGGAAFGLMAFCGAVLERGIDLVLEEVGFAGLCRTADLVLTGEGRLDGQSLKGKACLGVAGRAAALGVPSIAIVGDATSDATACTREGGGPLSGYATLVSRIGRERALGDVASAVREVTRALVREFRG